MKKREVSENVFINILIAVAVMLYFMLINFAYFSIENNIFILGLKILSTIVLILGIILLEVAYKKDSGKLAIHAIEVLVLAGYTLSIKHVVEVRNFVFENYILISSYVFSLYYLLKSIIIFTRERKEYLKSLSDIREIVDIKPTKKEAEKRKENYWNEVNKYRIWKYSISQ